jgi:hypothetical protein
MEVKYLNVLSLSETEMNATNGGTWLSYAVGYLCGQWVKGESGNGGMPLGGFSGS